MKTFLVTGATGGLGLEIVKNLAKGRNNKVIMAVRDLDKGLKIANELAGNIEVIELDLSQLANIRFFLQEWDIPLNGLINNAGVQFVDETKFTRDGYEETIAVNHLAAFLLTTGLMPHLTGGRVLFIGSGTHNPNYPLGKMFGFRGAQYTTMWDLIEGKSNAKTTKQINLDRYACVFRSIPDTHSNPFRTVIPLHSGHPFRFIPDTHSDSFRTPISIESGQSILSVSSIHFWALTMLLDRAV